MIIGIDHIAASVSDIKKAGEYLKTCGFDEVFSLSGVRNISAKKAVMRKYVATHDIALYKKEGSISIELLDHGHQGGNSGQGYLGSIDHSNYDKSGNDVNDGNLLFQRCNYLLPVLPEIFRSASLSHQDLTSHQINEQKNKVFADRSADLDSERGIGTDIEVIMLPELAACGLIDLKSEPKSSAIEELYLKVSDLSGSVSLWQKLGATVTEMGSGYAKLEFFSMIDRRSYTFILLGSELMQADYCIDDAGFNSIALLVTGARELQKELSEGGFEATDVETLTLGLKDLNIFFLRGPSGEIIELIEPNIERNK